MCAVNASCSKKMYGSSRSALSSYCGNSAGNVLWLQLLLEAPDDINCFKFSPTDSNIIAGGCVNGQVVLWDISQYTERLKAPRGGKKKELNTLVSSDIVWNYFCP